MQLSAAGRALIKGFEGLSLRAYPDAKGYSIGYGHFGVKAGDVITAARADELFDTDVRRFELSVSKTLTSATLQHQFDACCSLAYNIGTAGFESSTLARMHNATDYVGAAAQFVRWNKSAGVVHAGLVKRREKERAVYQGSAGAPWTGGSTSGPVAGVPTEAAIKAAWVPPAGYEQLPPYVPAPSPPYVPYQPPLPAARAAPGGQGGGILGVLIAVFFCLCS